MMKRPRGAGASVIAEKFHEEECGYNKKIPFCYLLNFVDVDCTIQLNSTWLGKIFILLVVSTGLLVA
jgi:hypothetical protein